MNEGIASALPSRFKMRARIRGELSMQPVGAGVSISGALLAASWGGVWEYEPRSNLVRCDRRVAELFGLDPVLCEAGIDLEIVLSQIDIADRERVVDAIRDALEAGNDYAIEYRVRTAEGLRWISARGSCFEDGMVKLAGIVYDITGFQPRDARNGCVEASRSDGVQALDRIAQYSLMAHALAVREPGLSAIVVGLEAVLYALGKRLSKALAQ